MNKLALLAFALLSFFSFMLWYLANGSVDEHLKKQVIVQSKYYSNQDTLVATANFSTETGIISFSDYSLKSLDGAFKPYMVTIETANAQLAEIAAKQLDSPSIQKKTTTLIQIETLTLNNIVVWIEDNSIGNKNTKIVLEHVITQLASDFPVLYPEKSAELFAKKHPERNEEILLAREELTPELDTGTTLVKDKVIETNQAIIASNAAKQQKRLLGKALTRIKIDKVILNNLTVNAYDGNTVNTQVFKQISLGKLGDKNGLASKQVGGELLKRLLEKVSG